MDCITAMVSDLHTNSTTGLCPPHFQHQNGTYKSNRGQRWLWRNWLDYWQVIGGMKADTGLPLVVVVVGDAVDGDHHDTPEIITRNQADQLRLAVTVLEPMLAVADRVFFIRGTESHVGGQAWMEELLADDITITERRSDEEASWWHLHAELGGVRFDIQHHPEAGGSRPWSRANAANTISAIVRDDYARSDDRIPHVAIRAHKHIFNTSSVDARPFVVQLPSWQLGTAYVRGKLAAGGKIEAVGGVYFICRDGAYTWDRILYPPRRDKPRKVRWTE